MAHVPRLVCVACGIEMQIKKNGHAIRMDNLRPERHPYYLVHSDLYECFGCGTQIALLANREWKMQHEPGFEAEAARADSVAHLL